MAVVYAADAKAEAVVLEAPVVGDIHHGKEHVFVVIRVGPAVARGQVAVCVVQIVDAIG